MANPDPNELGSSWTIVRFGLWFWGTATVILAAGVVALILWSASSYTDAGCKIELDVAGRTYRTLRDHGSLIGVLIGFSALAWTHFFNAHSKGQ